MGQSKMECQADAMPVRSGKPEVELVAGGTGAADQGGPLQDAPAVLAGQFPASRTSGDQNCTLSTFHQSCSYYGLSSLPFL